MSTHPMPITPGSPSAPALTEAQMAALDHAERLRRPLRRTAMIATGSGVLLLLGGLGSAPLALFGLENGIAALVLITIGVIEVRGAAAVRAAVPGAARRLMWNQIALGVAVLIYAGLGIARTLATDSTTYGFSPETASFMQQHPELGMDGIGGAVRFGVLAFYIALAAGAVLTQGGMAWWYARKERLIRAWREQVPAWTAEVVRRAA
jgi:multisubunit Na+/H+ antiporter MnhB subunit